MATKLIEAELKSSRVVPFSGKKEDWDMWQIKHVGRARVRGTYGVLMGTEAVPKIEAGIALSSNEEEIIELNTIAYNDLLQSCSEAISFNLVRTGITEDLPDGSAAQAWKNLCSKYSPNTVAEKIRLKKELQQLKLESSSDDPDVWLTKLELIRMQVIKFKASVSDDDLIMHVLKYFPSDYNQLIVTMEYMMNKDELDINNMREMLNLAFSRMNPGGNVEEKALAVKHYPKQFKKNCRVCGQQGHKAEDCWEKEENKNKRPSSWKSRMPGGQTSSNNANSTKKFEGNCNYCHKKGHRENECRKKKAENANIAQEQDKEQHVMVANHALYAADSNIWIGDTGATSHMTNNDFGMFDCSTSNANVYVGNGKALKASKIGKIKLQNVVNGKITSFIIQDVLYVPELSGNLFSLTKGITNGYELKSIQVASETSLVLTKKNFKLIFSKKSNSNLLTCDLERVIEEGHVAASITTKIDINLYHNMIGHPSQEITRSTARRYNIDVKGELKPCKHCAIGKAKQKAVPKLSTNRATVFAERIFFDLSWIKGTSLGGSNYWLLAVDESTKFCWSRFIKKKSDLKTEMVKILDDIETICAIKQLEIQTVSFLRCDNAGENKSLQKELTNSKPKITFEFTSPRTPQQNGVVERAFATLKGRVRSMLNFAGIQDAKRIQLWCEAANTATKITNILVKNNYDPCAHEKVYDQLPGYTHKLRVFGEIGIVSNTGTISSATQDRGLKCIFLGYAEDHSGDVYRFYNMRTGKIILSRDVIWVNKTYQEDKIQPVGLEQFYNEDEEDEDIMPMRVRPAPVNAPVIVPPQPRWVDRLQDELTEVYEHRSRSGKTYALINQVDPDQYCYIAADGEPTTYLEAIKSENAKFWIDAMNQEIQNMFDKKVWRRITKKDILSDKKLIGCQWVFKLNDNGIFRARQVALGYSQRPGIDFTDYYAPVVNDTTMKILIIISLIFGFSTEQNDIETAFLYGDLDEEVYMKLPPGYV